MDILSKIIRWAEGKSAIKALILQGSRAMKRAPDNLADYDLSVFCASPLPYTTTDAWLTQIAPVWVAVKETISFQNQTFPTRLVIFADGVKVDFTFLSLNCLEELAQGPLPDEYNRGYQILLDKENRTKGIPQASYTEPKAKKPTEQKFLETVEEFWFEAYHVALYLKRQDLWSVQFRFAAMHSFLLRMIEWEVEAQNGWKIASPPHGKNMASWVQPALYQELRGVFAHFDAEDSRKALFHITSLFRRLATDLSHRLGFPYPDALDKNLCEYIARLK